MLAIGLGGVGGGILGSQSILSGVQTGLEGVVGVDDVQVKFLNGVEGSWRIQLRELRFLGLLVMSLGGGVEAGLGIDLDQALGGQQLQGAASLVASLGTAMVAPSAAPPEEAVLPA